MTPLWPLKVALLLLWPSPFVSLSLVGAKRRALAIVDLIGNRKNVRGSTVCCCINKVVSILSPPGQFHYDTSDLASNEALVEHGDLGSLFPTTHATIDHTPHVAVFMPMHIDQTQMHDKI